MYLFNVHFEEKQDSALLKSFRCFRRSNCKAIEGPLGNPLLFMSLMKEHFRQAHAGAYNTIAPAECSKYR